VSAAPANRPPSDATSAARLAAALARLDALVDWERRDKDARMRRSLAPVRDLLARLGRPERRFRAVHVTGSKGKGTTAALVAAGLGRAGLAAGLYTSPHASRVHERVRIRGREIEDGPFAAALERALAAREAALGEGTDAREATWFDLLTAAAFSAFTEAGLAWAVVEVGLGGRLDSTNAVDGEVAVVTNIELEHVAVLGSTRTEIAREKAGIVKPGCAVVTSLAEDDEAGAVVAEAAREAGARVLRPRGLAPTALGRDLDLARLVLDELGRREVAGADGRPLSGALLDPATVESARLPARGERREVDGVPVVIDAAHVASSVALLLDELERDSRLGRSRPVCVLALGRDKDARAILKVLAGRVDRVLCTTVASGPLVGAGTLAEEARRNGLAAEKADDPALAFARALDLARERGWVLVVGSFYLAGAVRERIATGRAAQANEPRC
jgi:dihydrofolate synthase/folylpolyglutamate synthase